MLRITKVNSVVHFAVQINRWQRAAYSVIVCEGRTIVVQIVGAVAVSRIILYDSFAAQPVAVHVGCGH